MQVSRARACLDHDQCKLLKSSRQQTAKTARHGAPDTSGDRVKTASENDFAYERHLLAVCRSIRRRRVPLYSLAANERNTNRTIIISDGKLDSLTNFGFPASLVFRSIVSEDNVSMALHGGKC